MANYTLGQLIRFYREKEGLPQEELAEIIHVTKGKLNHWEKDETIPRPAMVARLIGALQIPDNEAAILINAHEEAVRKRAQEQADIQAGIDAQNKESERLMHKKKAFHLLLLGVAGFIVGCLIVLLTGSYQDNPWYFTVVIGLLIAGIPYGWSVLTDKSESNRKDTYYDPNNWLFNLVIKMVVLLLKFIGSYLIGVFAFPVVLFYHAYKACIPGSPARKIMCILFGFALLLSASLIFLIASAAFS